MGRILCLLAAIVAAIVFFSAGTASANYYVCGDANGDGLANITDAVYLIAYIFSGGAAPEPMEAGDANGDGIANITDAVYIIQWIFASGPAPLCTCGTVTDIDGNVYLTIIIGDQCWMRENLKVTHYRNGDPIDRITDATTWAGLTTGAYCEYGNDPLNVETYGRLYNWFAVDNDGGLAPEGWRVPSDEEWKQLETYLGMSMAEADGYGWRGSDEGDKLKEAGTSNWSSPNEGTNESSFTALPGGFRKHDGSFLSVGDEATFWSSTADINNSALRRGLSYDRSQVYRDRDTRPDGFSLRCIRDAGTIVIDPSPEVLDAPWELTGPNGYNATANGNDTLTWLAPGHYTITWGIVSGWLRPAGSVQTLAASDTITFSGEYTEAPDSTGTVTDIDGNVYQTIKICDQWWMMENLKVTHYRNGEPIPFVIEDGTWSGLAYGAYCEYANSSDNVSTYGRLYNWYAANDTREVAPEGWHVPTDEEWKHLEICLGLSQSDADGTFWRGSDEGGKLKESGTTYWIPPNVGATNESGFTSMPGGSRSELGPFLEIGEYATFWTSTNYNGSHAWYRSQNYDYAEAYRWVNEKSNGYSIRCVKD